MKSAFIILGSLLLYSIIVLVAYNLLKKFVLNKIKINKWVVLIIALVAFIVPPVIFPNMPAIVSRFVVPGICVLLFLWFMDLSGYMKKTVTKVKNPSYTRPKSNKNDIVIRPKAKPNRVKQNSIIKK